MSDVVRTGENMGVVRQWCSGCHIGLRVSACGSRLRGEIIVLSRVRLPSLPLLSAYKSPFNICLSFTLRGCCLSNVTHKVDPVCQTNRRLSTEREQLDLFSLMCNKYHLFKTYCRYVLRIERKKEKKSSNGSMNYY